MSLKERLLLLLDGVNPKQYARRLGSNPGIAAELVAETIQYSPKNISEQVYIVLHGAPKAKECGKRPMFNTFNLGYREFCGSKIECACARESQSQLMKSMHETETDTKRIARLEKQRITNLEKYGVENPVHNQSVRDKIKQTNLAKYGTEFPLQSTIVAEKIKQKTLEKYGVEYPLQNADIRQRSLDSSVARHGAHMVAARAALYDKYNGSNPFTIPEVKEKIRDTMNARYGRSSPKHMHLSDEQLEILQDAEKFKELLTNQSFTTAASILSVDPTTIARYCDYYGLRNVLSIKQLSVHEHRISTLLDSLGVKYEQNTKQVIPPLELDFYLPEYNVAIEVGSVFWHSELNAGRDKQYHWNKWKQCNSREIKLFQWFDDEIAAHWPAIENKILYLTGKIDNRIGARKVIIGEVSVHDERAFLEANHIQGFSGDRSLVRGAYYLGELVAIMAFADRAKYTELTRYATRLGSTFPGLFTKMLTASKKLLGTEKPIMSFSNNCHSDGAVYRASGFEFSHNVAPTYYYTDNYHSRMPRNGFMKSKLLKKHPELDPSKTEWELVQQLGYDRIWDAGKQAWILK